MDTAESCCRHRDGRRAVLRDPVAEVQGRARIAGHDDLLRVLEELPCGEPGRHRDRAEHRPPRRAVASSRLSLRALRPAAWYVPEADDGKDERQGYGDHEHRGKRETPGEQQRHRRQEPRDEQQDRDQGEPGEPRAGRGRAGSGRAGMPPATSRPGASRPAGRLGLPGGLGLPGSFRLGLGDLSRHRLSQCEGLIGPTGQSRRGRPGHLGSLGMLGRLGSLYYLNGPVRSGGPDCLASPSHPRHIIRPGAFIGPARYLARGRLSEVGEVIDLGRAGRFPLVSPPWPGPADRVPGIIGRQADLIQRSRVGAAWLLLRGSGAWGPEQTAESRTHVPHLKGNHGRVVIVVRHERRSRQPRSDRRPGGPLARGTIHRASGKDRIL